MEQNLNRPTVALCAILKNELKNIPRFLASVKGCFDEIHLTDTGSTDGSLELINSYVGGANPAETPIYVHEFQWCDDFSKARTASFNPARTDFVMWMDLDDSLGKPEGFIEWRNNAMDYADFWMATYHYALDPEGKPICSFARERVVRRSLGFEWKYFLHEGIYPKSKVKKDLQVQYAVTWDVRHLRDAEDLKADRSRNIKIFERHSGELDPRMRYYYGKELVENQKPLEGFSELMNAVKEESLELHDRIMGLQYACLAAMQLNQFEKAIQLAHQGLQLAPLRAEFYVAIGDCCLKSNRPHDSLPFFAAASRCPYQGQSQIQGALFSHADSYGAYPLHQMARVYAALGDMEKAEAMANESVKFGASVETAGILKDIAMIKEKIGDGKTPRKKTDDIVISCPPNTLYEWDEEIYKTKGIGGSETAAVEMARWMSTITGRKVLIFNSRSHKKVFGDVEYRPASECPEYFRDNSPAAHIAWRHVTKLSEDPMYLWCHDLGAMGIDRHKDLHKIFALSEFHGRYLHSMFGVPKDKIIVTRNGINPTRFLRPRGQKEFGKIVFSSSPDRGLIRALHVMDEVVKTFPEAKLHCYYGFDNMMKMGMTELAAQIQKEMFARPYVVNHGNLTQSELTKELSTACVWLYPTNFLETYCITAIEALCSRVHPVVRAWGALPDTLQGSYSSLVDHDCESPEDVRTYAEHVVTALKTKAWEHMEVDPNKHSWESVAKDWVRILGLTETPCQAINGT